MEKDGGNEGANKDCVMVAGRLTKLPSIRGLSFASRRLAEVGLVGIASSQFHHVSLPVAFKSVSLDLFSIGKSSYIRADMLGAKSLKAMSEDQGVTGNLPEDLDCNHHIAEEDSLAEEGNRRHS